MTWRPQPPPFQKPRRRLCGPPFPKGISMSTSARNSARFMRITSLSVGQLRRTLCPLPAGTLEPDLPLLAGVGPVVLVGHGA
jgi:hypothetical protein